MVALAGWCACRKLETAQGGMDFGLNSDANCDAQEFPLSSGFDCFAISFFAHILQPAKHKISPASAASCFQQVNFDGEIFMSFVKQTNDMF